MPRPFPEARWPGASSRNNFRDAARHWAGCLTKFAWVKDKRIRKTRKQETYPQISQMNADFLRNSFFVCEISVICGLKFFQISRFHFPSLQIFSEFARPVFVRRGHENLPAR